MATAPAIPDPYSVANAQTQANNQSASYNAALNNVNTNGPLGSTSYNVSGYDPTTGAPIYQQNTTLNPYSQNALNNQQGNQAAATGLAGNALQNSQSLLQNPLNVQGINSQATQAAYNQGMSLIQPQFDQQNEQLQSQLAAQGITDTGSQAYHNATDNQARQQAYQTNNMANQSILTGLAAGNQIFNQNQQAQTQAYNVFNGLNGQNIAMPNAPAPSQQQTSPANISGAIQNAYNGQLSNYNAQLASQNNLNSGLFSLGAAALGAPSNSAVGGLVSAAGGALSSGAQSIYNYLNSDTRLKTNIVRVGTTPGGLNVYEYNYLHDLKTRHVGVMAQEVERVIPDAVITRDDGFMMVDYQKVA